MERRAERGIDTPGTAQYDMFVQNLTPEGRQTFADYYADLKFAKENSAPETKLPGTGSKDIETIVRVLEQRETRERGILDRDRGLPKNQAGGEGGAQVHMGRGEKEEPKPTRPVPQCKECIKVEGKPAFATAHPWEKCYSNPGNKAIRPQKWADSNESFMSHHAYLRVEGRGGAAVVAARNCIACGKGGHTMETCRMLRQYEPSQREQIAEVLQKQRQELEKFRLVSSVAMKATTLANSANRVPLRNQRRRLWDLGSNRNVTDESRASSIREEGTVVMG
jgi:hypothetical protein